jgi:D-erythronate 2-dehydrogenase
VHAATLDGARLGDRRALTMPGLSVTVAEQIEALRELAGDGTVALIRREHDPVIAGIVAGWPRAFATDRARELGFRGEATFAEILTAHVEDELGGVVPVAG